MSDKRFPTPNELWHPELEFGPTAQDLKELCDKAAELRRQFDARRPAWPGTLYASGRDSLHKNVVATANHTPHNMLDREKRERMEQIEAIFRRRNPELTDEQLEELTRRVVQGSDLTDC